MEEKPLLEARPSWKNFIPNLIFSWLVIPLLVALVKRKSLVLRIYPDRVMLEKGIFSKDIKEVFISDIRAVEVKQTLLQRSFGIGDVRIATSGTSGYELEACGLPDPKKIKDLIIAQRRLF